MFKHKDLEMLGIKFTKMSNFHPIEVMGRDSETQLQMGDFFVLI